MLALLGAGALPAAEVPAPRAAAHEPLTHRMLTGIEDGVARVEPWIDRYGYGAVFGVIGVEGFGIPAPGQTILETAAVAAASGKSRLRIELVLLVAVVAASLGNTIGYLIGRAGGRELLTRVRLDPKHLQRVDDAFARYGGLVIVFARFFDGPRQINGIAAGILEMPWWRFTLFNLAGALLWAGLWALGVYYLDLHLDQLVAWLRLLNPWVAGATLAGVAVLAVLLIRVWWRRRPVAPGG